MIRPEKLLGLFAANDRLAIPAGSSGYHLVDEIFSDVGCGLGPRANHRRALRKAKVLAGRFVLPRPVAQAEGRAGDQMDGGQRDVVLTGDIDLVVTAQ